MKVRIMLLLLLIFTAFSACSQPVDTLPTTAANSQEDNESPENSAATQSPSPVATSTPDLPVEVGLALPVSLNSFNGENINEIQEVAVLQNGHRLARYTSDFQNMYIGDSSGISLCEMEIVYSLTPIDASAFEETAKMIPCQSIVEHYEIFPRMNDDHSFNSSDLAISSDGSHFLVVTGSAIQIFDREGNMLGELLIPNVDFDTALSVDGTFAALTYNDIVHIHDVSNNSIVLETDGTSAFFTFDGKYLAVRKRLAVYLYSTDDWSEVYAFSQDASEGWAISSDSLAIANSVGDDLVVHDLTNGELSQTITRFDREFRDLVKDYIFRLFPYMEKSMMEDFDYKTFYKYSQDAKFSVVFSNQSDTWKKKADQQTFYISPDGLVLLYSEYYDEFNGIHTQTCMISSSLDITCNSSSLLIDTAGNIFTGSIPNNRSQDLKIAALDPEAVNNGNLYSSIDSIAMDEDTNFSSYLLKAVNLEKRYFIGNYKYNNRVVDMDSGEILNTWKEDISDPIVSPEGSYIAFLYSDVNAGEPYRVGFYDYTNNKFQLLHYETRPASFAFSNDSTKLICIENEATANGVDKIISYTLASEEAATSETIAEFAFQDQSEDSHFSSLAISPDDSLIIVGSDNGYLLAFDPASGALLHQWQAHEDASILAVAFSPDGKTIYSSSEYGEFKVWGNLPLEWNTD